MLFNSFAFAIFFPLVFIVYWKIPHRYRWLLLLISSYYFYMSWNFKYVFIIFLTTIISYLSAILLEKVNSQKLKKRIVIIVLIICLGVLIFFKYFNFISNSITDIMGLFSWKLNPITVNVVLPVGISFYTFQTLSYVIDVYRGRVKAEHNFGVYATFISFFPQLVAGPIERTENLLPQITSEKVFNYDKVTYGLKLMAWGFFKKLAMADVFAGYVDKVYASLGTLYGFDYAIGIIFFTFQIYCDFSGYSDIARGCSRMLGIDLMENFKAPYFSQSFHEFWSRWHISLSTWFRDYVYIPLGGNRCSKSRCYSNLFLTFIISGLWHGASWTYVFWGGIHGGLQLIEKAVGSKLECYKKNKYCYIVISTIFVFFLCNLAWVFFRAESFGDALYVIYHAVYGIWSPSTYFHNSIGLSKIKLFKIFVCILMLTVYDYYSVKIDVISWISSKKTIFRWGIYVFLLLMIFVNAPISNKTAFIYFQF